MGSKQKTRQNQNTSVNNTTTSEVTGIDQYQKQFGNQYTNLANLFQNRIAKPMNLKYSPAFSSTLDPVVQNAMSAGVQNINAAENAAARDTSNRLAIAGTGNNGALLAALNRVSSINNAGAKNALIPAALAQQKDFDAQRQSVEQAQNALRLQARSQSINELAPGLSLLQAINSMAQTSAGKKIQEKGRTSASGGSYTTRSFL